MLGFLDLLLGLPPLFGLVVDAHERTDGVVLAAALLVESRVEHAPEVLLRELGDGVLRLEAMVLDHPLFHAAYGLRAVVFFAAEHGAGRVVDSDVGEHLGEFRVPLPVVEFEPRLRVDHCLHRHLEESVRAQPYRVDLKEREKS